MPRPSKGLTRRITLRTTDLEHAIVKKTQQHLEQSGVTLSENDTILFLIQCSTIPPIITVAAARKAIEAHWQMCEHCTPGEAPLGCAAGVYLHDRHMAIRTDLVVSPDAVPARTEPRRTVNGRRPLLPPAPGVTG